MTQSRPLTQATAGWMGVPFWPARFIWICGR